MRRVLTITGVIFLLVLTLQPVAAAPVEHPSLGFHVVQPGETLFCIARAYGVDPWAIGAQNGIISPNYITPGMVLDIPAVYVSLPAGPTCAAQIPTPSPCACSSTYTIVTGDNLYRIALAHGVSMWDIAACNGIFNLHYIRAGDTLCIP